MQEVQVNSSEAPTIQENENRLSKIETEIEVLKLCIDNEVSACQNLLEAVHILSNKVRLGSQASWRAGSVGGWPIYDDRER